MKSSLMNRYSSTMGTTAIFVGKLYVQHPNPKKISKNSLGHKQAIINMMKFSIPVVDRTPALNDVLYKGLQ